MKLQYEIRQAADHTWVDVVGEFDLVESKQMLAAVIDAAVAHNQNKVLLDCREVKGTPSTFERLELADSVARLYHQERCGAILRFAIVGVEPMVDPDRFGQTVAQNRGLPIRITTDMQEALAWLGIVI
jgi:hypothetical protein